MGRGSTEIVKECFDIIHKGTGTAPDTSRWIKSIEVMLSRGHSPTDIVAAVKIALSDQWHKAKLMDWGLSHIERHLHSLLISKSPTAPRPNAQYRDLFSAGKHQRWDAEKHSFQHRYKLANGRSPTIDELARFCDDWYAKNVAVASEWVDCEVCQQELELAKELGVDPCKPSPVVRQVIQGFDIGGMA